MQTEVEQLLGVGGIEDGHADGDEQCVGEIDRGRGFRAVVVACEREHAALGRGAGEIGVAQRIGGSIDARPLAVPDAEHAIDGRAGKVVQLLGAPDRGRGEIFVEAWAEDDVVLLELRRRAPQFDVVAPERRAAITGDIPAGVEARRRIAQALLNGQAHQRLRTGHIDPAFGRGVAGVRESPPAGRGRRS